MVVFYVSVFLVCTLLYWAAATNKYIVISNIQGFMLGGLYDKEEFADEQRYTIQILIGILSINILWTKTTS